MIHLLKLKPKLPKWIWFKIIGKTGEPWAFPLNWRKVDISYFNCSAALMSKMAVMYKNIGLLECCFKQGWHYGTGLLKLALNQNNAKIIYKYELFKYVPKSKFYKYIKIFTREFINYAISCYNSLFSSSHDFYSFYKIFGDKKQGVEYIIFLFYNDFDYGLIFEMVSSKSSRYLSDLVRIGIFDKIFAKKIAIKPGTVINRELAEYLSRFIDLDQYPGLEFNENYDMNDLSLF